MASFVTTVTLMADGADEKIVAQYAEWNVRTLGSAGGELPSGRASGAERVCLGCSGGRRRFFRRSFRLCSLRRIGAGAWSEQMRGSYLA